VSSHPGARSVAWSGSSFWQARRNAWPPDADAGHQMDPRAPVTGVPPVTGVRGRRG